VTEDWAAVARAVIDRMTELSLSQRQLIERSRVSKAIVGEIQNNTVQRHRSARTLEALSEALEWHPNHLSAVLRGQRPPKAGDPVVNSDQDVPGRLSVIEHELQHISEQLDRIDAHQNRLDEVAERIVAAAQRIEDSFRRPRKPDR
jgi:transcriptional regulator with XRE-family HTH domain